MGQERERGRERENVTGYLNKYHCMYDWDAISERNG